MSVGFGGTNSTGLQRGFSDGFSPGYLTKVNHGLSGVEVHVSWCIIVCPMLKFMLVGAPMSLAFRCHLAKARKR